MLSAVRRQHKPIVPSRGALSYCGNAGVPRTLTLVRTATWTPRTSRSSHYSLSPSPAKCRPQCHLDCSASSETALALRSRPTARMTHRPPRHATNLSYGSIGGIGTIPI
jgi:hypothetical protein